MSSVKAALYFGDYSKVLEVIDLKTPPGKFNRTVGMNSHGRRFQASIVTIELKGVHKLNCKIS